MVEEVFDAVDVHIGVAVEKDQIVAVAFVVTEEKVFAVFCIVSCPIFAGDFDCWGFGVLDVLVPDVQLFQELIQAWISIHKCNV